MKILFIINPVSGSGAGNKLPKVIAGMPEYKDVDYQIVFTEQVGHAAILAKEASVDGNYTHIIAVGGDGTVNEVGTTLYGSNSAFGVIPVGSGNGFARHVKYSLSMKKALRQMLSTHYSYIDMVEMNGHFFLNVSGVGFDAEIAHTFGKFKMRGVISYICAALKVLFFYKEKEYDITYDGKTIRKKGFILSFANSSQYGNNVHIAPHASLKNGMVSICIMRCPPFFGIGFLLKSLLRADLSQLKYYEEIQCKEAVIDGSIRNIHVDGEPFTANEPIRLKVHAGGIKIISLRT
ncbi:hypothetical protein AGMMS49525_09770 [Bacteroidia bacterium]|nr:hypothetical protein AGMMS49525_09770 [Bacteroidia bacterium]